MTTDTHGAQRVLRTRSASTQSTVWLATGLMITGASIQLIGMFHALSLVDAVREKARLRQSVRLGDGSTYRSSDALDVASETGTNVATGLIVASCLALSRLWLLLAYANLRGFRWARVAATVIGAAGIVSGLVSVATYDKSVTGTLDVLLLVAEVAVLSLLWLPRSTAYFRQVSASG
ncbi:hypothetical protein ACLTEW_20500 [Gordonia lacunae]|uniref:hypothetical protein n=1 Tax=Gordonia lacunae TaxID=417102 RepID=UPI0039E62D41